MDAIVFWFNRILRWWWCSDLTIITDSMLDRERLLSCSLSVGPYTLAVISEIVKIFAHFLMFVFPQNSISGSGSVSGILTSWI